MPHRYRAALAATTAGLAIGAAGPVESSFAACGATFMLGATNGCDGSSQLTGSLNGNLFNVTNTNTGNKAAAIAATVNSAQAGGPRDELGRGRGHERHERDGDRRDRHPLG